MKLWQKICIYFSTLFIVVFLAAGILLIENNTRSNLDKTIHKAAMEQQSIVRGIHWYTRINEARSISSSEKERYLYMSEYLASRIDSQGAYIELLNNEQNVIYSNVCMDHLPEERFEIEKAASIPYYVIRENNNHISLSVVSTMINPNNSETEKAKFTVSYITDISDIYQNKEEQYSFFIKIFLLVIFIMVAGIYILSKNITKSVRRLTDSVIKMSEGSLTERVVINSKDEIGTLSVHYNRMADTIEEKIVELQDKTKAQERFIDNFTHELKTPLTAIVGYSDFLRSTRCKEDEYQELAQRIFSEGKRIEKLSSMMMDLVFLEHHQFKLTELEMKGILWKVGDIMSPSLEQKKIQLIIDCREKDFIIHAEQNLIFNLFCNLIDNAIKASKPDSIIRVRVSEQEELIVVEIIDEGKGIPQEEVAKVFENFYMADKVRNKENNGIGLGLNICMEIAKVHNAKLELESEEGVGTTVRIKFKKFTIMKQSRNIPETSGS